MNFYFSGYSFLNILQKLCKEIYQFVITNNSDEADFHHYLNWLAHSDATLTLPQTVVLRYTVQEEGIANKAAEGYRRWFVARLKL